MHDNLITSSTDDTRPDIEPDLKAVASFITKAFCWALFALFVLADGLRASASYDGRMLTLPYFFAGAALCRAIAESLDNHYPLHTVLFITGLLMLGAIT